MARMPGATWAPRPDYGDGRIDYRCLIVHGTYGAYSGCLTHLQDPKHNTSATFVGPGSGPTGASSCPGPAMKAQISPIVAPSLAGLTPDNVDIPADIRQLGATVPVKRGPISTADPTGGSLRMA